MLEIDEINKAKHIVIVLQDNASVDYLASANALYTYLLQLHKKVSFYCDKFEYEINLNFLPWIDKLKSSYPSSSDYEINSISSTELLSYFMNNDIKLNSKMATSLYSGLLDVTKGFSKAVDGTIFAMAKLLVESGADVEMCSKNILNYNNYSTLRLKTILLAKISLQKDAQVAVFNLTDEDLLESGAKLKDAKAVLADALGLPTVKSAVVIYKNEEIMKEEVYFEKKTK